MLRRLRVHIWHKDSGLGQSMAWQQAKVCLLLSITHADSKLKVGHCHWSLPPCSAQGWGIRGGKEAILSCSHLLFLAPCRWALFSIPDHIHSYATQIFKRITKDNGNRETLENKPGVGQMQRMSCYHRDKTHPPSLLPRHRHINCCS